MSVQKIALRLLAARVGTGLVDLCQTGKMEAAQRVIEECNNETRNAVIEFLTDPVDEADMSYRLCGVIVQEDSFNRCYNGSYRYVSAVGVAGVRVASRCTMYPAIVEALTIANACAFARPVNTARYQGSPA